MKALILSAGQGTRLRPLTDEIPKCLVEISGKSILERQLDCLVSNSLEEIIIVIGYKGRKIVDLVKKKYPRENIRFVYNKKYRSTNNLYSFYLTKPYLLNSGFILMNGDVIFDCRILYDLIKSPHSNIIPAEKRTFYEESMKIAVRNKLVKDIRKDIPRNKAFGVSIDIYKFSKNASKKIFKKAEDIIVKEKRLREWTEVAIKEILDSVPINYQDIKSKYWIEIDNNLDLKEAKKIIDY